MTRIVIIVSLTCVLTACGFRTLEGRDCLIDPLAPVTGIISGEFSPVACQATKAERDSKAKAEQDAQLKAASNITDAKAKAENDQFEREYQEELRRIHN